MSGIEPGRFQLLSELTPEDLEVVAALLERQSFDAGHQLFREGQEADGLLLLDRGRVSFESKRMSDLGMAGVGTSIGALSLIAVGSREVTAVADEDCEVLELSRTAFHRLAEDAPRTACRVLEGVVREAASLMREGLAKGHLS